MKRAASTAGKHYSRKAYQQALALVFTISDMFVLPPLALNWSFGEASRGTQPRPSCVGLSSVLQHVTQYRHGLKIFQGWAEQEARQAQRLKKTFALWNKHEHQLP